MLGINNQRKFMAVARTCHSIYVDVTILNSPKTTVQSPLAGSLSDADFNFMQDQCPDLFSLAWFYIDGMPSSITELTCGKAMAMAINDPTIFMRNHLLSVKDLKCKIYSWLAISEHKRIKSLSKGLTQRPGSLPPFQAAKELDSRVQRLEIQWVDKSKLF